MGLNNPDVGFGHSASERASSLFETWPFSALQSREHDPNGSFYLQQSHNKKQAEVEYPDTGVFNSPVVSAALSSHAISPRFLGASPSTLLTPVAPMPAGAGVHMHPVRHRLPPHPADFDTTSAASVTRLGAAMMSLGAHANLLTAPAKNYVQENPRIPTNYYVKNPTSGAFMPVLAQSSRVGSLTGFPNPEAKPSQSDGVGIVEDGDDDRRYSRTWPYTAKSPSIIEFDTRASPSFSGTPISRQHSAAAVAARQRVSDIRNNTRTSPSNTQTRQQSKQPTHTVPLVGAWTINRWLSVMSEESSTAFMVWSIHPYSTRKREHALHPGRLMFSQPFTTTRGYKMRAMVALNGTGPYEGRYISVFWQLLPSPDDHNLSWPMKDTVTVRVLPAGTNEAFSSTSVSGHVRNPKSFLRPEGNRPTPPWGFKKFISHQNLESGHFIQADTLWLAFEVTEAGTGKFGQSNARRRKPNEGFIGDLMWRFFYNKT